MHPTVNTGPTTCSDLPSLTNGMILYSAGESPNDRPVDATASYSCANNGFSLVGEAVRTCGSGGTWGGTAATCQGEF